MFCDDGLLLGPTTRRLLRSAADMVRKAAAAERFKGKLWTTLDIFLPAELDASRLIVVGCGHTRELKAPDYLRLGGVAMGKVPAAAGEALNVGCGERVSLLDIITRLEALLGKKLRAQNPGMPVIFSRNISASRDCQAFALAVASPVTPKRNASEATYMLVQSPSLSLSGCT